MTAPSLRRPARHLKPSSATAAAFAQPGRARIWPFALIGAACGLSWALISQFPASWAAGWLEQASGQRLLLQGARGTIWNGSAELGVTGGTSSHDARLLPGRLSWRMNLGWWPDSWWPALNLTLMHDCCQRQPIQLALRPGWNEQAFLLRNLDLHIPASLLDGLGTPWNTMALEGTLSLSTTRWYGQISQGRLAQLGQGRLQLTSISSRASTIRPLGNYLVTLQGGQAAQPGPFSFKLSTPQGALQLSGQGELTGAGWRFQGEAGSAPEHRAALGNVLNLIGTRNGPISFIIRR